MKRMRILSLMLSCVLLLTILPIGSSALGNNEVLRETYAIYELDLNCLDNFILLHFYESEAYKVFIDMKLTKNSQIQSMYKRLKDELTGEETPEEVFPYFEKILYNEVLKKGLTLDQLKLFISHTPETLKALGVNVSNLENLSNMDSALKGAEGKAYEDINALAEVLKKVAGSVRINEDKKEGFTDISNVSWAEEAINYLSENGIIGGKSEGIFAPSDVLKREELAKILVLAFELNEKAEIDYKDSDENAWYYEFLAKVTKSGLMNGYGDEFGVGEALSREDLAVICGRYLKQNGRLPTEVQVLPAFTDEEKISDYAKEFVKALSGMGIINGLELGEFAPKASVTRAQAAKIIYETLKTVKGVSK